MVFIFKPRHGYLRNYSLDTKQFKRKAKITQDKDSIFSDTKI